MYVKKPTVRRPGGGGGGTTSKNRPINTRSELNNDQISSLSGVDKSSETAFFAYAQYKASFDLANEVKELRKEINDLRKSINIPMEVPKYGGRINVS
jgi:hypothetical protein